jgi:hypothetical protein
MSSIVRGKLKGGSAVRDLGCSTDEFRIYLESLFTGGMSWDNYGKQEGQWSIDHHMPLYAFNLEDRQHFLLANHYLNLRPMWHKENREKGYKIPFEFHRTDLSIRDSARNTKSGSL